MKSNTLQFITTLILVAALAFSFAVVPMSVSAHDGEDHSEEAQDESEMKRQLLIQIISLLQQIIEARTGGSMSDEMMNDDHDHDSHEDHAMDGGAELLISVETHAGRVHVHVDELGQDEVSFFLDDYEITDKAGIIAAIAIETGFSEADVEAAAHFPDEAGENHDEHEGDDNDLAGIHIMADGTVMLGNGEAVEDATVNEDGMIVLADGTIVEPTMDMR